MDRCSARLPQDRDLARRQPPRLEQQRCPPSHWVLKLVAALGLILLLLSILIASTAGAAQGAALSLGAVPDPAALDIPDPLRPWIPWVLRQGPEGQDERGCPLGASGTGRICAWPGRLRLDLSAQAGRFEQPWTLYADQWVVLPGDAATWPLDVRDAGEPVPVLARDGRPAVRLETGTHALTGRFAWTRRPESLLVPPATGLVDLMLDGKPRPSPLLEKEGRLWIQEQGRRAEEQEGDRLGIEVYRRIEDDLPLMVSTRLELSVSGRAREVRLGPVTLAEGVPLRVQSELPARLEADGRLLVQVRPGRWQVQVQSDHPGAVSSLTRRPADAPWPAREVWVFVAQPELRQVEVGGLSALDPRQARLPDDWGNDPVYLAEPEGRMTLTQQRRGDSDPEPDRLSLTRELWLDFDGLGYTARDRISGQLTRSSRLEAGPALTLGQVSVGGVPQVITRLHSDSPEGVEVRPGPVELVADARLEAPPRAVPASGWAATLDSVRTALYLPPGWDLLAVSGVDNLPETWLYRWTLLDLFLVLILAIGIGRLWGWGWGALALAALALTWQSPGAPQLVWLHLLAAAALLRLLPKAPPQVGVARLRGLVLWYWRLSLLALLVVGLPFLVSEVRGGLYPQLAHAGWGGAGGSGWLAAMNDSEVAGAAAPQAMRPDDLRGKGSAQRLQALSEAAESSLSRPLSPEPSKLERMDPDARVQTGPGIPTWRPQASTLSWSGPVGPDARARLWLLDPTWTLVRALLGSVLICLLGLRLAGVLPELGRARGAPALLLALGLVGGLAPPPSQAAEWPSAELLEQLRERLLEPPECLPACLDLPRLVVHAEPRRLELELTLDAAEPLAAPVPGGSGGWSPVELSLDGAPLERIGRSRDAVLLVPMPGGRHLVRLSGPLPGRDAIDIPLPLTPRLLRVEADGWRVDGLDANGRPGRQIQLVRVAAPDAEASGPLTQEALPPLLRIERRLKIGLDWRVETRARRLSAPEPAVLLPVPLLPGELVQTPGMQVQDGQARIALAPGQLETAWTSSLDPVSELSLTASPDTRLAELWELDLSPLWHLDAEGIPQIHHRGGAEGWLPTWRPLPGETLRLHLRRPEAVPGPTLTLDRVDYQAEPGRRGTEASLVLGLRSSQGGRHLMRLPDGAELRRLQVDGRALPLPVGEAPIELPLTPGASEIRLAWQMPEALTPSYRPSVPDLGAIAVNLSETVRMPRDRWVLLTAGPVVGPVVLFWGVLLVMSGLALLLGRSRLTPLRAHDWLLLSMGLVLAEIWVVLLVAAWLFALGLRRRLDESPGRWRFNFAQIGLILLTLAALAALVGAVQQGLLGHPDMQIVGNGSSAGVLRWYQDRGGPLPPEVWVLSVPMWAYRALMLAWALWLAFRLLDWLRWGWDGFSRPHLWRGRLEAVPRGG